MCMRVVLIHLLCISCAALKFATPDDASQLTQQPDMPHVSEDGMKALSKLDPDVEVSPNWVRHRPYLSWKQRTQCRPTVAVCIVGQLSRLETKSKMDNLFSSMSSNSSLHAFVVADADSDFYVNPGDAMPNENSACRQKFATPSDVQAMFAPFYQAGSYLNASRSAIIPVLKNWRAYASEKPMNRTRRIMSHFRQWVHLSECATLIKKHEEMTGCKYLGFMKLRDNGIVTKPMKVHVRDKLVVKNCCGHLGVNDKLFLAPRLYLDSVLEGPLKFGIQVNEGTDWGQEAIRHVVNPEQFWQRHFNLQGVPWKRIEDHDEITVVDGRCMESEAVKGETEWCLVGPRKDCHPNHIISYNICSHQRLTYGC